MQKTVIVSKRLQQYGIKENHRGFPTGKNIRVFGADTETCRGKIFTYQIASEGEEVIARCEPKSAFLHFMEWVNKRSVEKGVNIVFFHNLRFDLTVLFQPQQETIYNQYNDIRFERDGYVIQMLYGRVNFVRVWKDLGGYVCARCGEIPKVSIKKVGQELLCDNPLHGEPTPVRRNLGPQVRWIDSAAFCPPGSKSLVAALKIYGVGYRKLAPPKDLGKVELYGKEFEDYALNDARAEEALGRAILDLHKEYDITPCISLPQLSARILRHHFFRKGESFPFPPEPCRIASELSYHAGKNGFYVKSGVYEDLYEYDINSAFPKAMKEMPQMVKGDYHYVKKYVKNIMGIYRIKGRFRGDKYPIVFDASFRPIFGSYTDTWVTAWEIDILRKAPGNTFKIQDGWVWRHDSSYLHSPLAEFVSRFWELKNTAPKGPKRDTYKNILNSLYGKFAACVEKRPSIDTAFGPVELNEGKDNGRYFVAGSLYHPFIATQITGYVRARLYELEKAGQALHAATDSIKSRLDLPTGDDLGGIKKEVFGRCYLFRNKLYLHFGKDTSLCGHNLERGWLYVSEEDRSGLGQVGKEERTGVRYDEEGGRWMGKLFDNDGQHLCKYGLHGFKGSVFFLYRSRADLINKKFIDYEYDHMVNLREGRKRGEQVCDMTRRKERLTLVSKDDKVLAEV